ncbi:MAG: hypothetical protein N2646_06380 [Bellilinea sp.]|nr:hypothetical protein [Bellilinea sp.]
MPDYPRLARLTTPAALRTRFSQLNLELDLDDERLPAPQSPLAQPLILPTAGRRVGNRWCIQPMEGWDGTPDGKPSELTRRRWRRFGESGAKLIWGGEAVAVCAEGRANPNQLIINEANLSELTRLRQMLVEAHAARWGAEGLLIGLQLTHSGRFSRPESRAQPVILYHHPLLDRRMGLEASYPLISDAQLDDLIGDYVRAARLAQAAGFDFVDIKHCHGYLLHEMLSAVERPGGYGGPFENRTRFLRQVVAGIRSEAPGLLIGVRLSAFDFIPFTAGEDGVGRPEAWPAERVYPYAFGGDGSGTGIDLRETHQFLDLLESLGVELVNLTAGSPYYCPHIQRPALFPPSDGYQPPEDPLVGVARQIRVVRELKARHPKLIMIGSAYSYLQEWLPQVAQFTVRNGWVDAVGIGRMALAYPELCGDVLTDSPLQRKRICRTFSDCTTAPRLGLVSGCYPLDEFYKKRPEGAQLENYKRSRT